MSTYTQEQRTFIDYNRDESIILSATAGSGKTHSTVGRLNKMIEDGVDPKRMIFFSFTNDAVNELKRRIKHDVNITTIHSFTSSVLGKLGKFRPIVTFYNFVNWYKEKYRPDSKAPYTVKKEFQDVMDKFYEEGQGISATFSAYKLQSVEGIKLPKPKYYAEYEAFIRETKSRDFADMLIDTEKLTRDPKYKDFFNGMYDYIFVDEYQDTSSLQMKILLAINARQYHLIGDKNQSIYGFSGANCAEIEHLLQQKHKTVELTLTKNFRSHRKIVEHSNKFSSLQAVPHHEEDGAVHYKLIEDYELYEMIKDEKPLTVLVRTNAVIKDLEFEFLKKKYKMRYFNYLTNEDITLIKDGKINPSIKRKLDKIVPFFKNTTNLLNFIEENKDSDKFITSIHKSKGREFPRVVIVNSIDPDLAREYGIDEDYTYEDESGDVDIEAKNVHYVAVTRPMHEVYFMIVKP